MRTTIELPDELRAKLLELAARRGEKGFSGLVAEAVARYLEGEEEREERVRAAKAALGSLDDAAAEALEASVRELRGRWR
jgi:metal-responsive CopG/Arc/MetJ family transcriptional regulator